MDWEVKIYKSEDEMRTEQEKWQDFECRGCGREIPRNVPFIKGERWDDDCIHVAICKDCIIKMNDALDKFPK